MRQQHKTDDLRSRSDDRNVLSIAKRHQNLKYTARRTFKTRRYPQQAAMLPTPRHSTKNRGIEDIRGCHSFQALRMH